LPGAKPAHRPRNQLAGRFAEPNWHSSARDGGQKRTLNDLIPTVIAVGARLFSLQQ
jgi:hypothetical protein